MIIIIDYFIGYLPIRPWTRVIAPYCADPGTQMTWGNSCLQLNNSAFKAL